MVNLAEIVTKDNIIKALNEIMKKNTSLIPSTKFDLVFRGKRFPPKEVIRIAAKIQGIKEDEDYRLSGGENTNRFLREKGFNIRPKSINNKNQNMLQISKIPELKQRWDDFLKTEFYTERVEQLKFVPFAKRTIEEILKQKLSNNLLSGILQITNNRSKEANAVKYITQSIPNLSIRDSLIAEYKNLHLKGFTTSSKGSIYGLDQNQLNEIKTFLTDAIMIKSIKSAIDLVRDFDSKNIPQVKKGIYSPWLYYLNSEFFPIQNDSHIGFIEWCDQQTDSYIVAIQLFHEVGSIVGEKDLGVIDAFAYSFIEEDTIKTGADTNKIKSNNMHLNTILYGPPGTGKTYNTINKAVEIINPSFFDNQRSREEIKKEYERLRTGGQIEFITFHQSLSYEDFIEGIKPMDPKETGEFLKYETKDGIFKRLVERASRVPGTKPVSFSISDEEFQEAEFYKISLGDTSNPDDDQIYEWCIKNGYIALGWGDAIDFTGLRENDIQQMVPEKLDKFGARSVNIFIHSIKLGYYVVVTYGNHQFRAIGRVSGNYEYKNIEGLNVHQFKKVDWLWKDGQLPYEEVYNKQFSQQSIYHLDKREIKKDFFVKAKGVLPLNGKLKNYVLIIDEINRGNVSQIFGELITLIEEDKRNGKDEALTIILPYSKKPFSVPSNLYLIGTMNTADRSVEALDTALRRRFEFEEKVPKTNLLSSQYLIWKLWSDFEDSGWEENEYSNKEEQLYKLLGLPKKFGHDGSLWGQMIGTEKEQISVLDKVIFTGINLQLMLEKINYRLAILLDKDHAIGHAWLMNMYSHQDLQLAFKNKILPLLQEYFYNNYAKIGLILGDKFVKQDIVKGMFAKFKDDQEIAGDYEGNILYSLIDPMDLSMEDFKSIYE